MKDNKRYALSFDEYTGKNRRYLTVNVHTDDGVWFNLGMVRVWNSQTAETVLKLVKFRLSEFGLTFDHIVAMVTDGASIMIKLGCLAPCDHVVCLSHTLHLVIKDVFYPKKKKKAYSNASSLADGDESDDEEDTEIDQHAVDEDSEEDDQDADLETDATLPIPSVDGDPTSLSKTIEPVITKVRVIVRKFRKSPVKNDCLQEEVKKKFGKELNIMRDCKIRNWSSLHAMLQRFIKLEEPVNKILDNLDLDH